LNEARAWFERVLRPRLTGTEAAWWDDARAEIAGGVDSARFSLLLSSPSRRIKRRDLEPTQVERSELGVVVEGLEPERWDVRDTVRIGLVLARPDLEGDAGPDTIEEAFRYADESESVALYRSLALSPQPERYVWRAGEGCRTNMVTVFEAVALDTPFPALHFDPIAFDQAVIKTVFPGSPLLRLHGLGQRLTPKLAEMALDLMDERRSAHREVQPDLWMALGEHGGERARNSIELEFETGSVLGRCAAGLAGARAGYTDLVETRLASESDPTVSEFLRAGLNGRHDRSVFGELSRLAPANS